MDPIVPADIKSWPDGTKKTEETKQKSQDDFEFKSKSQDDFELTSKSQDDFELTSSLDHQMQEEEYLMDRDNVSDLKKKQIVSFSRIHKEVYKLANSKQSISEGIVHALNVIEESLRRYGPNGVSLSFNGGKDCVVLLHLFAAAYYKYFEDPYEMPKIQALYITHPNPFPEVENFVKECIDQYFLDMITIEGQMKLALTEYSIQRPEVKAILVGTRRNDPHGGKLTEFTETDPGWPSFMRVHPILDLHYTKVWEFLRTLNVPYCVLYDLGYTSLGSIDNTHPNPDLRNPSQPSGYDPAWKLTDESRERCGRGSKKPEIEKGSKNQEIEKGSKKPEIEKGSKNQEIEKGEEVKNQKLRKEVKKPEIGKGNKKQETLSSHSPSIDKRQ